MLWWFLSAFMHDLWFSRLFHRPRNKQRVFWLSYHSRSFQWEFGIGCWSLILVLCQSSGVVFFNPETFAFSASAVCAMWLGLQVVSFLLAFISPPAAIKKRILKPKGPLKATTKLPPQKHLSTPKRKAS